MQAPHSPVSQPCLTPQSRSRAQQVEQRRARLAREPAPLAVDGQLDRPGREVGKRGGEARRQGRARPRGGASAVRARAWCDGALERAARPARGPRRGGSSRTRGRRRGTARARRSARGTLCSVGGVAGASPRCAPPPPGCAPGATRRPVSAMRAREHFSPANESVTATATSDGADGQHGHPLEGRALRARRGSRATCSRPPAPRSSAGILEEAQGGALQRLRAAGPPRRPRSGRAAPPPPPNRGRRARTRRRRWPCRGSCATRSGRGRPRGGGPRWPRGRAGESIRSCRVTMAPIRRSPSSDSDARRGRARTGRGRSAPRGRWRSSRVPPASGHDALARRGRAPPRAVSGR